MRIGQEQIYNFSARTKVEIACNICGRFVERTINSIRINTRKNGVFCCHQCICNTEEYKNKQTKSHIKTAKKWDSKVSICCCTCGRHYEITYRSYQARLRSKKDMNCQSCSNKKTHNSGKFKKIYCDKFISKLKITSSQFWSSVIGNNWKSVYMADLLAKPEYHKLMSECGKKAWLKPGSREAASKRNKILWETKEYKEKMAKVRITQSRQISSIQKMLYAYLDGLGVEYHKEGEQTRIGYYVFDCLVINGNKKILIECQGDYWHSLPKAEKNDKRKFTYVSRYFPEYEIMYVWEHEFYCKDRVLDRLKLKLGIEIETKEFKFSDLVVREINSNEIKTFLDLYHYLGKDRGGKAFGVFDNDLLVACIVFSPPLRQNTAGQFNLIDGEVRELSRLCIHPLYHKKNFASWFIKRTLKQIDCKLVVAYADTTVGHDGGIYKASNFKLHHIVPADYWYVDRQGYVMHKRTLYGKARKNKMTESEFAEANNYIKKYGGEKLCFIRNI